MGAAGKPPARRRHAAQADHDRLAVLLFLRRLHRRLLPAKHRLRRLRCRVKCVRTRRLVFRVLHRRLVRGARLLRLLRRRFLRRLLLLGLLRLFVCKRLLRRLRLGFGVLFCRLLRLHIIIAALFRRIAVFKVVHCDGLPLSLCLYSNTPLWQFVENNMNNF